MFVCSITLIGAPCVHVHYKGWNTYLHCATVNVLLPACVQQKEAMCTEWIVETHETRHLAMNSALICCALEPHLADAFIHFNVISHLQLCFLTNSASAQYYVYYSKHIHQAMTLHICILKIYAVWACKGDVWGQQYCHLLLHMWELQ